MRKSFAIISFLILASNNIALAKERIRITTGEWAPYLSESLENKGMIGQLATEAFALKGVDVEIHFFPWARATELSKSGEWDGTLAFARIAEREPFYYFSSPVYVGRYVFFHLKKKPLSWEKLTDLKGYSMASTRGFGGMGDEFLKAEREGLFKVLRLTSDEQSFNMLKAARVDTVPSDLEVGYFLLYKLYGHESEAFTHSPRVLHESAYHLVISKKCKRGPKLLQDFNDGLKQLQDSGRYKEIVKAWHEKAVYRQAIPAQFR